MEGGILGQYRVTHLIGAGGMGAVYAAEHTLIGRPAAIKVLLPEFSQNQQIVTRFFNEAKAATAIRHPGIVEIYDFGWHTDGSAFIVMEFLQGETLGARSKRGRMPLPTIMALMRQISGALAAAHSKGIVHRDLKPDNVFLVPDADVAGGERAKLLDFGIAKLVGEQAPNNQMTRTGSVMGTPTYMAPEQCRGVTIDHRADLYSLGVIFYELLAGRTPFVGEGSGDVLAAHIHVPPPPLSSLVAGVPPAVEQLVHALLIKSPAERPQSAEQLIAMLDAVANSLRTSQLDLVARVPSAPVLPMLTPHPPSAPHIAGPGMPTTLSGAASDKPVTMAGGGRGRTFVIAGVAAAVLGASAIAFVVKGGKDAKPEAAAAAPEPAAPAPTPAPEAAPAPTPTPTPAPTPTPTPPTPTPTPETAPPTPPAPASIDVSIASTPTGADVLLAGKKLGATPFKGTLPKSDDEITLTVRRSGYKDKTIVVRANAPITQTLKLDAKPRASGQNTNRDQSVNPFGN